MAHPRNLSGPLVRKIRNEKGISQAELARRCQIAGWDISREIVAKIEMRIRWVADFELGNLAKVLEVPLTDLLPQRLQITSGKPTRPERNVRPGKR